MKSLTDWHTSQTLPTCKSNVAKYIIRAVISAQTTNWVRIHHDIFFLRVCLFLTPKRKSFKWERIHKCLHWNTNDRFICLVKSKKNSPQWNEQTDDFRRRDLNVIKALNYLTQHTQTPSSTLHQVLHQVCLQLFTSDGYWFGGWSYAIITQRVELYSMTSKPKVFYTDSDCEYTWFVSFDCCMIWYRWFFVDVVARKVDDDMK